MCPGVVQAADQRPRGTADRGDFLDDPREFIPRAAFSGRTPPAKRTTASVTCASNRRTCERRPGEGEHLSYALFCSLRFGPNPGQQQPAHTTHLQQVCPTAVSISATTPCPASAGPQRAIGSSRLTVRSSRCDRTDKNQTRPNTEFTEKNGGHGCVHAERRRAAGVAGRVAADGAYHDACDARRQIIRTFANHGEPDSVWQSRRRATRRRRSLRVVPSSLPREPSRRRTPEAGRGRRAGCGGGPPMTRIVARAIR
jgi:hypothetical protein